MTSKYELVVWLEVHARIKTKSKLFCSCVNEVFDEEPNSHICPVCSWFPGQLPVLNNEAVKKIVLTWKALDCDINSYSKFDRKSYFYPDLPLWYQISQYDEPVCWAWKLEIYINWENKSFWIHRIHLENDAWKLTHWIGWSEVDLNRSWCPLMEIVTNPDFRNSEEIKVFLQELQKILRAIETSDADMEKWQMRADVNISLRPYWQEKFWTRAEIKNMNSFSAIERAIKFEFKRQSQILDEWWVINQETRWWDDKKWISQSQRSKEEAVDYRYFPEPDIPPLNLSQEFINELIVPELPMQKYDRLQKEYWIKAEDAFIFAEDKHLCEYFEKSAKSSKDVLKTSSWILSELLRFMKEEWITILETKVLPSHISEIVEMIVSWTISWKIAKDIFPEVYQTWISPVEIVEKKWLKQNSDTWAIEEICKKVLESNPQLVADFKWWKERVFWAFVWMSIKESKWQANPQIVNQILKKLLS